MKNILVTGGSGKAGRATIKLLLKNNYRKDPNFSPAKIWIWKWGTSCPPSSPEFEITL